jgi:hypothetical protein
MESSAKLFQRMYSQRYKVKYPNRVRAIQNKYYHSHKEKILELHQKYRERHREKKKVENLTSLVNFNATDVICNYIDNSLYVDNEIINEGE